MSMQEDALFREVDEELRRDQLKKLWEQYGTYFLGAAALIVVGVGGNQWWQSRRIAAAEAAGSRFEAALEQLQSGKADEATKELTTIAGGRRDAYATLARLSLAGEDVKAGKTAEAAAEYEAVAKDAPDQLLKDFARLQAASLKIDSADFTEVKNRLNDLIGDKSPWRYMARELWGMAALRSGQVDEARQVLAPLSADPRAPTAVRERAEAMMGMVVAAELEKSAPAKVELEPTEPPAAPPAAATKGAPQPVPAPAVKGGKAAPKR